MASSQTVEFVGTDAELAAKTSLDSAIELANYKRLVARAVDVLGVELKASRWLSEANVDLDGQTPLQAAETHGYDGAFLEPLFIRIEHGIYSSRR